MQNNQNLFTSDTPEWIKPYLINASQKYGLPTIILSAQISNESGFNPTVRGYNRDNVTGVVKSVDRGIAQINGHWHPEISDQQADDPNFAVNWMAKTMADKYAKYGDYGQALSEYNTGNPNDGFKNGYVSKIYNRANTAAPSQPQVQPVGPTSMAPKPTQSSNVLAAATQAPSQTSPNSYTVKAGDTLWGLAQKFLGNGNNYGQLGYGGDPKKLAVGTKLNIPGQSVAQNTSVKPFA